MKPIRMALILLAMVVVAGLFHLAIYRTNFTYTNISNVLFVVGVIVFLPSVIALTNAFKAFYGIRYALRVLMSPSFRREYPHYKEYKEDRKTDINTAVFTEILITSAFLLVVAAVLAVRVMS